MMVSVFAAPWSKAATSTSLSSLDACTICAPGRM
jgi:hypothetical protein